MKHSEQITEVLDFLDLCVLGVPRQLSSIRYVFRLGKLFWTIDADTLLENPSEFIPQIFKSENYLTLLQEADKYDIHIVVVDQRTCENCNLESDIDSQPGGDYTLIGASNATKITYKVVGADFSDDEIEKINAIATRTKIIDRVNDIRRRGADLQFDHVDNIVLRSNLAMLDGGLAEIIAQLLLEQFSKGERMFTDIVKPLAERDPYGFATDEKEDIYIYKLKNFLSSVALGMMPSKYWDGSYDVNGGYIIVKKDGEILCFHNFRNLNRFQDYLFANAYIEEQDEIPLYGCGLLYRGKDGNVYFKLSLQVRLK